ncbi:lysosomal Pro-X carboxypeptidase-like [Tripterygium wilfordii]|uniref:lysosomal Pro-X carboxypeptidase-like n=1 Tax=Tripterygium wilfordii TaxID=458696 RepID=UPI0018F839F8|nr:lysosomal Pro-X carboxypeptidase-like [Tripterygium wilfordii]
MKYSSHSYQWIPLLFSLFFFTFVSATPFILTKLKGRHYTNRGISSKSLPDDFKTFKYSQTLDHFNYKPESYQKFQQRFVINQKYWDGADGTTSAPIFALLGHEDSLDASIGLLTDQAIKFKALLVYIEHRYYGESIPFGSAEKAFKDATTLGYLNSAQALADYAEILIHVKEEFEAQKSPIIVIGLSYGGMLASWFRLKYPHIAVGALASSAPILFFEDITPQNAFALVVSNDFKGVSENCYDTIKRSWSIIDEIASAQHGLRLLSTRFKTCKDLKDSSELKKYLEAIYTIAAQSSRSLVQKICQIIDQAPTDDSILDKIMAVVVAIAGDAPCYVIPPESAPDQSDKAWEWQKCTEIVMPGGRGDETMFQRAPFNQNDYNSLCMLLFAIRPRTHWITTYYGGRDIKLTLKRFASNIIFSNGLRDPYSSGGVLEDISETILAVTAEQGTHCEDIYPTKNTDPNWLVTMRETEFEIIQKWITQYYTDLQS